MFSSKHHFFKNGFIVCFLVMTETTPYTFCVMFILKLPVYIVRSIFTETFSTCDKCRGICLEFFVMRFIIRIQFSFSFRNILPRFILYSIYFIFCQLLQPITGNLKKLYRLHYNWIYERCNSSYVCHHYNSIFNHIVDMACLSQICNNNIIINITIQLLHDNNST